MSGPGIKFGHFTLGKRLARGGMAEVFLARQRGPEGFDRRVAVKRILPHLAETPDFVRMFLDEARLAARLSHPNIVHIYELGQVDGDYFIAMEFVDGVHAGQLAAHAATEPLPPVLAARIGADAAGALAYAHRLEDVDGRPLQLVHRDVSPHNIMVSFDGVTKLVDFGIAKAALKADETRPGIVKGKYAYMSPEQTVGRPLDGRSDVFSLGIVLWEILAGTTIVDRGDVVEAMKVIRDGRWRPIEAVAPRTPPALAQAIGWALAHKRDDRATAAQLQVALEEFIKSSPQIATSGQLADWIRPRFPRAATGAQAFADDDAPGRARRPTGPSAPRPGTSAVAALPARPGTVKVEVTPPPERATARVEVTAAPPPLRAATAKVDVTEGLVPAPPPFTSSVRAVTPAPRAVTPAPRAVPPPLPASVRAPTHLDTDVDLPADESPDAPTRLRIPSTTVTAAPPPPRRRIVLAIAILLALAIAIGLAAVIAGGGADDATAPDAAAAPTGPDAAPVVLPMPLDDAGVPPADAPAAPVDAPAATPAPDARTAEVRPIDRPPVRPPDRRRTGYLTARTTPYSVVTVDGRQLETPFSNVELPAGTHVLTFTHPGRRPVQRTVRIRPGDTTKLSFTIP